MKLIKDLSLSHLRLALLIILVGTFAGCSAEKTGPAARTSNQAMQPQQQEAPPEQPVDYGSIAVIDINIKHPTAALVFKNENVRDRIIRGLHDSKGFSVIDWSRMEDVLFRRNLQNSDLVSDEGARKEIAEMLLNDYFLNGTVTSYGERMEYSSSAFSKKKAQIVEVELELFVKDSLTNEIVATANGLGFTESTVTQTLGFGAAGGNDTVAATRALGLAIDDAVGNVLVSMKSTPKRKPAHLSRASTVVAAGYALRQPEVKVLIILSEVEEKEGNEIIRHTAADRFESSSVEHAIAKVFSDSAYQVLTADDVLGKAYGISGDENILLSGWVDEQDIEEFENLLQARSGLASYALKVGKMAHADIVVSGTVKYQLGESRGPGNIKAKTNSVLLTAKAVLVDRKETYHLSTVDEMYMTVLTQDTMKAREKALIDAATQAGLEILARTPRIQK